MSEKDLLKKISPVINGRLFLIPDSKWSPVERKRRRLALKNENSLYRRKSSLSGDFMISFFDEDAPYVVYTHDEWWSDLWDPLKFGRDFDFNRDFFEQFYELKVVVPRMPLINNKAENSPYCNWADGNKNCHMVTTANWNQDSFYSFWLINSKDVVDCTYVFNCELSYECSDCLDCYDLRFCRHSTNCSSSAFLYDCVGTRNSIFCVGLRSAQFSVFNKPVSEEEFKKVYFYYFCGSYQRLEEAKQVFAEFLGKQKDIRKTFFVATENVSGNNIFNSKNIIEGYDIYDSQDCVYVHDGLKGRDCVDTCFFDGVELCYDSISLIGYGLRFCAYCRDSSELIYCDSCYSCKNCFGCVGLRNKQYCIFNKQYSADEYFEMVSRIIEKMKETDEWGEFFPIKNSTFAYNETLAHYYFPLEKAVVLANGWMWKEPKEKIALKQEVEISDNIDGVDQGLCNQILVCEKTGRNYKIIPLELAFYKKMHLPLPRLCPEERGRQRLASRTS